MGWGWYTCPVYDSCPYTRECQSLTQQEEVRFQWRTHDLPCWFMSLYKRGCLLHDLMHHLPSLFFPPILDLPLSLKSICTFTSTRSPGFKFTVPILLS